MPANALLRLQRTAGNRAVATHLAVQRDLTDEIETATGPSPLGGEPGPQEAPQPTTEEEGHVVLPEEPGSESATKPLEGGGGDGTPQGGAAGVDLGGLLGGIAGPAVGGVGSVLGQLAGIAGGGPAQGQTAGPEDGTPQGGAAGVENATPGRAVGGGPRQEPTAVPAPSPALEPPTGEAVGPEPTPVAGSEPGRSEAAGDTVQIAILDAAGGTAVGIGASAVGEFEASAAASLAIATSAHTQAMQSAQDHGLTARVALMGIVPSIIGAARRVLALLTKAGARIIGVIGTAVRGVATTVGTVLRWARTALGGAIGLARSIGSRLRSVLGGAGEAITRFVSSLLTPARNALSRLRQAAARVLATGLARVREAVTWAIDLVIRTAGTVLQGALAAIVQGVGSLVAALRNRLRSVMGEVRRRVLSARSRLRLLIAGATSILRMTRARALRRTSEATALVIAAMVNGLPHLATASGRRRFATRVRTWLRAVAKQRAQVRRRHSVMKQLVVTLRTLPRLLLDGVLGKARSNAARTEVSLTMLEVDAAVGAGTILASAQEAAATAIGSISEALAEGDRLVREVAGEGDRDAADLQQLVERAPR